jgi:hypothetical protein
MVSHPIKSGYLNFLINDLRKLRENRWSDGSGEQTRGRPSDEKKAAKQEFEDVEQQLLSDFAVWREADPPPDVNAPFEIPFPTLAHLTFAMMVRASGFSRDYAIWAVELWRAKGATLSEIHTVLKEEMPQFERIVSENSDARLWFSAFHFLGALHYARALSFSELLEFTRLPESAKNPGLPLIFQTLAEVTQLDRAAAVAAIGSGSDLREIVGVIELVDPGPPQPPIDGGLVAVGLYIRDLVFEAFREGGEDADILAIARGLQAKIAPYLSRSLGLAVAVLEAALGRWRLGRKQISAFISLVTHI